MKLPFLSILITLSFLSVSAQSKIDVLHYKFAIELSDANDSIHGIATITFVIQEQVGKTPLNLIMLDLEPVKDKKRGMQIIRFEKTSMNKAGPLYKYSNSGKLLFHCAEDVQVGDTVSVAISYRGIPSDGLIISKNKFGNRTFFADNWPDRAHFWIPVNEDPADKASFEFLVTAPLHYQVVANGFLVEETNLSQNRRFTHWKEDIPLSTKIMAIGVADFAVNYTGNVGSVPVSTWVYPEDRERGFYDFEIAKDVLAWMVGYIGPFPYQKLANVESTTRFGGMENAGAIFYNEKEVTGMRVQESTIAHEIAHQWFGDMATEKKYAHLWLSEGFATYFSHLYLASKYGEARLDNEMESNRGKIIDFVKTSNRPVVDSLSATMDLLNANSYDKGCWFLHMLRTQLGDSVFRQVIRTYYSKFAGANADTKDFQSVAEAVSGKNLEVFFKQWLYTPGIPDLKVKWTYAANDKKILITVEQVQKQLFEFPLDLRVVSTDGSSAVHSISITKQSQQFSIPANEKPARLTLDPRTVLLFEAVISSNN
ncbi:MAG TPA: M1 family metallopeptidase [Chitinophagaceae bacterium]|nr:M1 family metallopeptidase [Chitinophagaceae bacterium]